MPSISPRMANMLSPPVPVPPEFLPYLTSVGRDIGAGLAFLDREGRFIFVSDGLAAMNGLPPEAHLGRTIAEAVPVMWPRLKDIHRRVLAGEAVKFEIEGSTMADPDRPHRREEYWTPARDGDEVVGIVATVTDVTELSGNRARQQELTARQSTLRAIANHALSDAPMREVFDEALAALQRHLRLPFVRATRVVSGSDRLEVYAEEGWDAQIKRANPLGPRRGSFADYVLTHQRAVQFNDLSMERRFRQPLVFIAHGIRSGVGVRVSSGEQAWGHLGGYDAHERLFDCHEIAFVEELAAILGLMVHERDSRAFREEVLSMASHQMRTPLTSVIGLAQHIQRRLRQGRVDSLPDLLDSLVSEAFRLDDVLTQWNELAAAESYREVFAADEVDVGEVVGARVEQFRSRHDGMVVRERYPDPCATVATDARRVGEILDNLLENASKYGGNEVEVTVECRPGGVAVHCRDHGPGVPPDIAPYIFDRFFRGSSSVHHTGMGLGLYISRKLAEGLGGTLDVTSTPGDGAHFTLFLPNERRKRSDARRDLAVRSQPER